MGRRSIRGVFELRPRSNRQLLEGSDRRIVGPRRASERETERIRSCGVGSWRGRRPMSPVAIDWGPCRPGATKFVPIPRASRSRGFSGRQTLLEDLAPRTAGVGPDQSVELSEWYGRIPDSFRLEGRLMASEVSFPTSWPNVYLETLRESHPSRWESVPRGGTVPLLLTASGEFVVHCALPSPPVRVVVDRPDGPDPSRWIRPFSGEEVLILEAR